MTTETLATAQARAISLDMRMCCALRSAKRRRPTCIPAALRRQVAEEEIAILEANLDDLNPQLIGYIVDWLLPRVRSTSSPLRCR